MLNVAKEVAALNRMAVQDLRVKYAEAFGDETKTGNKPCAQTSKEARLRRHPVNTAARANHPR